MKPKDKKTKESTKGKIIYGFLLFMPLLAIFVKCGYTMFNKNAYKSYYGETVNEEVSEVTTFNEVNKNTLYTIYTDEITKPLNPGQEVVFLCREIKVNNTTYENYNQINITRESSGEQRYIISIRGENQNTIYWNYTNSNFVISFYLDNLVKNDFSIPLNYFTYNQYSYVDNVFYYSVNQISENPLFNWTQNTFIYTGVQTFTNALNINNVFFPLLLSYWMIISVIYIIYDMGLMMIQIVHRKIHELGDSI